MQAPTLNDKFELSDESYSLSKTWDSDWKSSKKNICK